MNNVTEKLFSGALRTKSVLNVLPALVFSQLTASNISVKHWKSILVEMVETGLLQHTYIVNHSLKKKKR